MLVGPPPNILVLSFQISFSKEEPKAGYLDLGNASKEYADRIALNARLETEQETYDYELVGMSFHKRNHYTSLYKSGSGAWFFADVLGKKLVRITDNDHPFQSHILQR